MPAVTPIPPTKATQAARRVGRNAPDYTVAAALTTLVAYYAEMPAELTPAVTVLIGAGLSGLREYYFRPTERRN
jgi:hypothetical protein